MTDQPTPVDGTLNAGPQGEATVHADKLGARIGLQGGVMDNQEVIWEYDRPNGGIKLTADGVLRMAYNTDVVCGHSATLTELGKAHADLYRQLNPVLPPLPTSPEGQEWKRVETKNLNEVQDHDIFLCRGQWMRVDDTYGMGCAYARGWVMRLVPIPVEWPKMLDTYWTETITAEEFAVALTWHDTRVERKWKERGIIHRTESEAVESCKARLGISALSDEVAP